MHITTSIDCIGQCLCNIQRYNMHGYCVVDICMVEKKLNFSSIDLDFN